MFAIIVKRHEKLTLQRVKISISIIRWGSTSKEEDGRRSEMADVYIISLMKKRSILFKSFTLLIYQEKTCGLWGIPIETTWHHAIEK